MSPAKKSPARKSPTKSLARSGARSITGAPTKAASRESRCRDFSVSVKVRVPGGRFEITFGIRKTCNDDNTAFWTIDFILKQKEGDEMVVVVEVHVTLGREQEKEKAEARAAQMDQQGDLPAAKRSLLRGRVKDRALELDPEEAQDDPELKGLLVQVL